MHLRWCRNSKRGGCIIGDFLNLQSVLYYGMLSIRSSCKNRLFCMLIFICALSLYLCLTSASYANQESWGEEFNDLCGDTQKAMTLEKDDLNKLVVRCDKLSSELEGSDSIQKKAYIYRTEKCKNFYLFLIELLETEGSKK